MRLFLIKECGERNRLTNLFGVNFPTKLWWFKLNRTKFFPIKCWWRLCTFRRPERWRWWRWWLRLCRVLPIEYGWWVCFISRWPNACNNEKKLLEEKFREMLSIASYSSSCVILAIIRVMPKTTCLWYIRWVHVEKLTQRRNRILCLPASIMLFSTVCSM